MIIISFKSKTESNYYFWRRRMNNHEKSWFKVQCQVPRCHESYYRFLAWNGNWVYYDNWIPSATKSLAKAMSKRHPTTFTTVCESMYFCVVCNKRITKILEVEHPYNEAIIKGRVYTVNLVEKIIIKKHIWEVVLLLFY
jgi:hypothetical protein